MVRWPDAHSPASVRTLGIREHRLVRTRMVRPAGNVQWGSGFEPGVPSFADFAVVRFLFYVSLECMFCGSSRSKACVIVTISLNPKL